MSEPRGSRGLRWLLCGLLCALLAGCELVADFDRDKIPVDLPDANIPGFDGGASDPDAATPDDDAGADGDAAMDVTEPTSDASTDASDSMDASDTSDAQAGDDAGDDDAG
ncbi:MAG: hypothetical protein OEZ06_28845 [Myxococcales bacterium]|nr:hypothetical protein [Myxococcales bacterium]